MPQLRQANRVRTESCPDSDMLTAFTEDQLPPFVRGAITTHLAQCPECSEICARLANFTRATVPAHDPEWTNAEKRLENWKDGFLQSRAPANRPSDTQSLRTLKIKGSAKTSLFGNWGWAFGAVAALILIAGGVAVVKTGLLTAQPPVANRQAPSMPAPQPVAPANLASENASNSPSNTTTAPDVASNQSQRGNQSASVEPQLEASTTKPKTTPQPAPQPKVPSQSQSHKISLSPDSKKDGKPKKEEKKDDKDIKAEKPESFETAHTYTPPVLTPNDRILTSGSKPAVAPSAPAVMDRASVTVNGAKPATPTHAANTSTTAPKKPLNVPPSVQLAAGSRLWIQVTSINHQADGSFTFRGSLLQPTELTGAAPLEQGTELAGSGTSKDGKVMVAVSGFSIQGVPYTLPAKTGSTGATPGTGKALPFQNGQVYEMWVSSASTYEKAVAGTSIEPR